MSEKFNVSRLDALPKKVSMPLQKLFTRGLLDEETISVVLDAGELDKSASGNQSKLLAFTAGCLFMEARHIPVRDTIRMAKEYGRRIDLDWSATRWKQEHARLSRVATMVRLAGENLVYDLSKYENLLPPLFKGYLIRSSRRLGMEGLRQRHCVASYHDRVYAGYCAIASVLIDHQRWTVEISFAGNSDPSLRINQIKTRFNQAAPSDIREQIHAMLGIKSVETTADGQEKKEYLYLENLSRVLPVLRENNVVEVVVEFDGYGDSGSIQSVTYDANELDGGAVHVEFSGVESVFQGGKWERMRRDKRMTLDDAIEALTYDYLAETNVNWYDNDGGYGELIIDVIGGTVSLEVNTRFTETLAAFGQTLDIETGEVI